MKVGTDGVLLGTWTDGSRAKKILDIGTGTGIIALMLAQKYDALIDAIEIDPEASRQAHENISLSLWKDKIKVINKSFQEYISVAVERYDLIVTNPPFYENSLKASGKGRVLARHNDSLSMTEILAGSGILLKEYGILSLILPYVEGNIFIATASVYGLYCTRKTCVIPAPGKPVKRLLLEFSKTQANFTEDILVISSGTRHNYTEKFKLLTRDYYLNFRDEIN